MKQTLFIFYTFLSLSAFSQVINPLSEKQINDGSFVLNSQDKSYLATRKIVGLGESNHNMGSTTQAKIAMVKYLHDSLAFNTLAIESSIYDCYHLNKLFEKGTATEEDFFEAIFGVWKTEEMRDLYHYIVSTYQTNNPIKFIGIDNQFTDLSKKYLVKDIQQLEDSLRKFDPAFKLSERFYNLLKEEIKYSNYFKKFSPEDTLDFCNELDKLEKAIEQSLNKTTYFDYWKQIPLNLKTDFTRRYHQPIGNLRDSIMAVNMLTYYHHNPNEKIILWAATYHLVNRIQSVKSSWYKNSKVCGEYLKHQLSQDYYVIGFTPFNGTFGSEKGLFNVKLKKLSENSIEYQLMSLNKYDYIFYNLHHQTNGALQQTTTPKSARILVTKEFEIQLENVCDGIFIIRNSTGVKSLKAN